MVIYFILLHVHISIHNVGVNVLWHPRKEFRTTSQERYNTIYSTMYLWFLNNCIVHHICTLVHIYGDRSSRANSGWRKFEFNKHKQYRRHSSGTNPFHMYINWMYNRLNWNSITPYQTTHPHTSLHPECISYICLHTHL